MLKRITIAAIAVLSASGLALQLARWRDVASSPPPPAGGGWQQPIAILTSVHDLTFSPAEVELGELPWGAVEPFVATLINDTGIQVTVTKVATSCGCTSVNTDELVGRILQPGEPIDVAGVFVSGRISAVRREKVTVETDRGETCSLVIGATIAGTWRVVPESLDLGETISQYSPIRVPEVVFISRLDELLDVNSDAVWLRATMGSRSGDSTPIQFSVDPQTMPLGRNLATVLIRTNSSVKPSAVMYVRGTKLSTAE